MGTLMANKKEDYKTIRFNKDYYVTIFKPVREELSKQLNRQVGKVKHNKDGNYTITILKEDLETIDKILDALYKTEKDKFNIIMEPK